MKQREFTVHKYVVQNNRMGLYIWASQNNKSPIYEASAKTWVDLESFNGDRIPLKIVSLEYKNIADLANEPNLGLKVVQLSNLKKSPFYKVLTLALNPILLVDIEIPQILVLRLASRYFGIMTEAAIINCQEFNDSTIITFTPTLPDHISYHQIEGAMFGFARLVGNLMHTFPNLVQFTHTPETVDHKIYQDLFHCLPLFKQDQNQLTYNFPKSSHEVNYPILINPVIHALKKQFPDMPLAKVVNIILLVTLGFVSPTRQNIADALSISIRTLQRRLEEEGHTFNELLLEVRKQRVVEYLSYQQITVEQLSLLLGYKAKSQFLKAFRTWFGVTPKEYRAKINSAL